MVGTATPVPVLLSAACASSQKEWQSDGEVSYPVTVCRATDCCCCNNARAIPPPMAPNPITAILLSQLLCTNDGAAVDDDTATSSFLGRDGDMNLMMNLFSVDGRRREERNRVPSRANDCWSCLCTFVKVRTFRCCGQESRVCVMIRPCTRCAKEPEPPW